MTVSTTTRKKSYTGNGSTTVFAYDFRIFNNSDLKVYVNSVAKTLDSHYTVSGAGAESGGNVTFTSGNTPPDTHPVVILRELPRTQATDYVDNSALSATSLEDTADKNLMLIQEIDDKAGVGFRFADTVTDAGTITIDKNAADRANKLLSFDAGGASKFGLHLFNQPHFFRIHAAGQQYRFCQVAFVGIGWSNWGYGCGSGA